MNQDVVKYTISLLIVCALLVFLYKVITEDENKKSIFKFDKKTEDFLTRYSLIIAVLIFFPLVTTFLVNEPGYTTIENDWIGFFGSYFGSIMGGLLTLVGVLFTISYQKLESKKAEESLQEQLNIEKEKLNKFIDLHQKAFIIVGSKTGNIDLLGQEKEASIVNVSGYEIVRGLFAYIIYEQTKNIVCEDDLEKEKLIESFVYKYHINYLRIENLGPGYAYEIYWRIESDQIPITKGGGFEYLKKDAQIYIPLIFRYGNIVNIEIVYKDCSGVCRKVAWKESQSKHEEIDKDEYNIFVKDVKTLSYNSVHDIPIQLEQYNVEDLAQLLVKTENPLVLFHEAKYCNYKLYEYTDTDDYTDVIYNTNKNAMPVFIKFISNRK